MKVLFAINDDNITNAIVNKYQQKYKEIITSKNVYYFNAIIKELQRDKSYDAVVIGEDLEPISNNSYEAIDKFLFDKLDYISDEATKNGGEDIPIIFICSERRTKSDQLLVKLFSIGVYDALIGADRSINMVCALINKPRNKKEAKKYYKIESDDVDYKQESNEEVSESEIQSIISHYKRIGSNVDKCVESFNRISEQYDETQLRIIVKFLPLEIKAILETNSPIYQKLVMEGTVLSNGKYTKYNKEVKKQSSLDFLEKDLEKTKLTEPVVIPSSIDVNKNQTINIPHPNRQPVNNIQQASVRNNNMSNLNNMNMQRNQPNVKQMNNGYNMNGGMSNMPQNGFRPQNANMNSNVRITPNNTMSQRMNNMDSNIQSRPNIQNSIITDQNNTEVPKNVGDEEKKNVEPESSETKRGRGRPKKQLTPEEIAEKENKTKRGRGRPRKIQEEVDITPVEEKEVKLLNGPIKEFEEIKQVDNNNIETNNGLNNASNDNIPNNNVSTNNTQNNSIQQNTQKNQQPVKNIYNSQNPYDMFSANPYGGSMANPYGQSFEDFGNQEELENVFNESNENTMDNMNTTNTNNSFQNSDMNNNYQLESINTQNVENNLLIEKGKVAAFVGTTKNGTSFVVNNLALALSQNGINTAIVDLTKNKNSYYMFTNNDSRLMKTAMESLRGLSRGVVNGLQVNKYLTVFTALPGELDDEGDPREILKNISSNFEITLLDCDFKTNSAYFVYCNEIYLVQSMDAFTIQPLTQFLSDLKTKNLLDENKLRIVINKYVKMKRLSDKMIIGGMSKYNEPSMTLQRDLFNSQTIKYMRLPFDEQTYTRYLEEIAMCNLNLNGYSRNVLMGLEELRNMVYPLIPGNKNTGYNTKRGYNTGRNTTNFSSNINDTLNKMRLNNQ